MVHGERQRKSKEGLHTAAESAGKSQESEKHNKIDNDHTQPFLYSRLS